MQKPLFELKNLVCKSKGRKLLAINKFEIHRGIIYAIAGQPGSGKSTLMEVLVNRRQLSSGEITYEGDPIRSRKYRRRAKEELYYLPQSSSRRFGKVQNYMLRRIRTASWSTDSAADRLKRVSKPMNISDKLDRKVKDLSPGERRWIELAICLASDTKVLLIDELEQHLGYDDLDLVKRLIQRKCNHEGTTVVLTTLNPVALRKLNCISVALDHGRIAGIRSFREGSRGGRPTGNGGSRNQRGGERTYNRSRSRTGNGGRR